MYLVCLFLIDRAHRFAHIAVYGVEQNEVSEYVPDSLHKIPKGNLYLYSSLLFVLNVKHQSLLKWQEMFELVDFQVFLTKCHLILIK